MWIILPDKSEVADVLDEEDLNRSKVKDFYKDENEDKEE
jgi:hypothetical protein